MNRDPLVTKPLAQTTRTSMAQLAWLLTPLQRQALEHLDVSLTL